MTWTLEIGSRKITLTDEEGTLLETKMATAGLGMYFDFTPESTGQSVKIENDSETRLTKD
jgi:hypothetical protein